MMKRRVDCRYLWRKWMGWCPVQWCMVCGRPYWGGLPRWTITWVSNDMIDHKVWLPGKNCHRAIVPIWLPWWKEYCSCECSMEEWA